MNSVVGPNFKVIFAKFRTCGSREQCMGPTEKNADAQNNANVQNNANMLLSKPNHDTKMM